MPKLAASLVGTFAPILAVMPQHDSEPTPAIDVIGISKAFGTTQAVDDLSFTVTAGASLALIGPSGCGKTTILRMLAGLERPDAGTIMVNGTPLAGEGIWVQPEKRHLGMVFQDWALFPHLTVLENVEFGLNGAAKAAGHGREALEMVQLADLHGRRIHELSGGQSQRVALARALATRPQVMLFDEAFSSLDAQLTSQVRVEVADLMKSLGIASVYVTHDQAEAFAIADHIAVMKGGVLQQLATPVGLYSRPVDAWVAHFVGQATIVPGTGEGGIVSCCVGKVPVAHDIFGECTVLLRPESLQLASSSQPTGSVISRVKFEGGQTMYEVSCHGQDLEVSALGPALYAAGDHVDINFVGSQTVAFLPN